MNLAFNVLITEKLLDKSAASTIIEICNEIIKKPYLDSRQLNQCSIKYSDETKNMTGVNDAYNNLQLSGAESFVEVYIEIEKHNRNEPIEQRYKDGILGKCLFQFIETLTYKSFIPQKFP